MRKPNDLLTQESHAAAARCFALKYRDFDPSAQVQRMVARVEELTGDKGTRRHGDKGRRGEGEKGRRGRADKASARRGRAKVFPARGRHGRPRPRPAAVLAPGDARRYIAAQAWVLRRRQRSVPPEARVR